MNKTLKIACMLLAANLTTACSTENDTPLGPIGEAPGEEEEGIEHIYLWPEDNMPATTDYTVNNGGY